MCFGRMVGHPESGSRQLLSGNLRMARDSPRALGTTSGNRTYGQRGQSQKKYRRHRVLPAFPTLQLDYFRKGSSSDACRVAENL
jgi:hypothetical protein